VDLGIGNADDDGTTAVTREPTLQGTYSTTPLDKPMLINSGEAAVKPPAATSLDKSLDKNRAEGEEVSEGDVVRIDTNFVTVPVSVLDRQGRFIPDLRRDQFKLFENGEEQKIAYFEPNEKPFTVALMLDTSASTFFHLWEIKEAAIAFAKQLRPQDRVLVVTFDKLVMLLTEATNDANVVTEVIERNAVTGFSTRLYDAVDLVIKERLNKIEGRKAIVLFTDGVDTSSYLATYNSTLREVEEVDALIYPIQYDTRDFVAAQNKQNVTIVTQSSSSNWPFPSRSSSRVVYSNPTVQAPGTSKSDYQLADQYLHQLAAKSGGRLYQANDRNQLAEAFSKIAEELRHQYSLGYYPQTTLESGERRLIKVKVDQPDVAVRARDSYMQRAPMK
jgi:VWFA-related protein